MLFLSVNSERRFLNYNPQTENFSVLDIVKFQNLIGFDTLWSIAIESKVSEVSHECRNFVVDIYLKTNVEPKYKRKFTENFLKRVEMDHVKLNEIMKNKNYDVDF